MHDHSLLHNDLKPANIFLDSQFNGLVGDLGFASQLDPFGRAELLGGTPQAVAPEVATVFQSHIAEIPDVDLRICAVSSDVFSLGATLYWLLAGHPPFPGDHNAALASCSLESDSPARCRTAHAPERRVSSREGNVTVASRSVPKR